MSSVFSVPPGDIDHEIDGIRRDGISDDGDVPLPVVLNNPGTRESRVIPRSWGFSRLDTLELSLLLQSRDISCLLCPRSIYPFSVFPPALSRKGIKF